MKGIDKWREYITEEDLMKATLGATRLYGAAPSIVEPGESFELQMVALGADGYPSEGYRDEVQIRANTGVEGLPERVEFSAKDEGIVKLEGLSVADEGTGGREGRTGVSPFGFSAAGLLA